MSYALEVRRLAARVADRQGRAEEATFFLHATSAHGLRPETLGERLNDPALEFLPCELGGRKQLLRLGALAYVEVAEIPDEAGQLEQIGAHRAAVSLHLVSGESLRGDLVYEAPASSSRVSDFLNHPAPRFLLLLSGAHARFVHRGAIFRVEL